VGTACRTAKTPIGKLDENKEKVARDKEANKGKSAHKKRRDTEVTD
jgi:hypothetical protein